MATGATIHRVTLGVADIDRGYYGEHTLRVARHPSETDERMLVRILAFALHASPTLAFGGDLSSDDDGDLRDVADDGTLTHAICVGTPDPKWLRKAAGRANRVTCHAYGSGVPVWWRRSADDLARLPSLQVIAWPTETTRQLAGLAARTMALRVTVQESTVWIDDGRQTLEMQGTTLKTGTGC